MIHLRVTSDNQDEQLDHDSGPLELGRGPQRQVSRLIISDPCVSRDQLQLEPRGYGNIRVQNLSRSNPVILEDGNSIAQGGSRELSLPLRLSMGNTRVEIKQVEPDLLDAEDLQTIAHPFVSRRRAASFSPGLASPGEALDVSPLPTSLDESAAETITSWLERVIALQQTAISSRELHEQTAKALVDLIGLDQGMVLERRGETWVIAASHAGDPRSTFDFSRTLMKLVMVEQRTFFQDLPPTVAKAASLQNVEAVIVSPIFGLDGEVRGALYGVRESRGGQRRGIRRIEAQLVQLLAASVGAHQARATAARTRMQLEQFFSPELARELERDPKLLEGRQQEVTILVSDLRGFTPLAEQLGAADICRLVRDMMERLTRQIAGQGGVVVDYAGDGIVAMWNAPAAQDDHVARACRAALAMQAQMPELNADWQATVGTLLVLGIGLNTGTALVGNTGSSRKFQYGPIGLAVNIASRIQDATKKLKVPILISDVIRQRLPETFHCRLMGPVELAGVADPVVVHELSQDVKTRSAAAETMG